MKDIDIARALTAIDPTYSNNTWTTYISKGLFNLRNDHLINYEPNEKELVFHAYTKAIIERCFDLKRVHKDKRDLLVLIERG